MLTPIYLHMIEMYRKCSHLLIYTWYKWMGNAHNYLLTQNRNEWELLDISLFTPDVNGGNAFKELNLASNSSLNRQTKHIWFILRSWKRLDSHTCDDICWRDLLSNKLLCSINGSLSNDFKCFAVILVDVYWVFNYIVRWYRDVIVVTNNITRITIKAAIMY